ncbi:YmiA family putative membrane protein [Serratia sp. root2]|nr:YmiA family putative membrane protein [Serratia sp. root2]MDT3253648.1 YmiA family putative membrane protein [Serratia sp. root2]
MIRKDVRDIKRKAWLCVFIGCGMFWLGVAAVIYGLLMI